RWRPRHPLRLGRRRRRLARRPRGGGILPQRHHEIALGYLAALGNVHLLYDARRSRRHIHRRLVPLARHDRRVPLDGIARLHQHIDDHDVLEPPHVRNADLHHVFHGSARFASILSFSIAAVTVFLSTFPSSSSERSTAKAMKFRSTSKYLRSAARESER